MPVTRTTRNRDSRVVESISVPTGQGGAPSGSYIGKNPSLFRRALSRRVAPSRSIPTDYIGTSPSDERFRRIRWIDLSSGRTPSQSSSASQQDDDDEGFIVGSYTCVDEDTDDVSFVPVSSWGEEDSSLNVTAATDTTAYVLPEVFYEAQVDESEEDDTFVVKNETRPEDTEDSDDIPVRLLTDFTIYDVGACCRLVPFSVSFGADKSEVYGASGLVAAWSESDTGSSDDSDDGSSEDDSGSTHQRISIPRILEVIVHSVERELKSKLILDPKIYLRTEHAWYILDVPAKEYRPFYTPFWTKCFIFHELITSATRNNSLSYPNFITEMEKSLIPSRIIGRKVASRDVERHSTHGYVVSTFEELRRSHERVMRSLENVPAIRKIRRPKSSTKPRSASKDSTKSPPKKTRATVVTPKLHALCRDLFPLNKFEVCGLSPQAQSSLEVERDYPVHEGDPQTVRWVKKSMVKPLYYSKVIIDGVTYAIGDTVIVEPGDDDNRKRAAVAEQSSGADTRWHAKICYFYEDECTGEKQFHAQWYEHGSQTILQEVAHPQSLYLTDECDDLAVGSIYCKIDVKVLDSTEDEPEEQDVGYFTGLVWDREDTVFFQRREEDIREALEHCDPNKMPCVSCGIDFLDEKRERWSILDDGSLSQGSVSYHVHDIVYLRPASDKPETDVYVIGQITKIHELQDEDRFPMLDVLLYQRFDLAARKENKSNFGNQVYDERRLYQTDQTLEDVQSWHIEGKVYVVHKDSLSEAELEDWLAQSFDHLYVDMSAEHMKPPLEDLLRLPRRSFKQCKQCYEERVAMMAQQQKLRRSRKPLRGLELFAGAGGLSTGFDQSGFVKTRWAAEMEPSAVLSYNENHPHTTVYNGDVNVLLKHAIETSRGKRPNPLKTVEGIEIPLMPKQGEVDFIYGGPPCQGFSGMNHTKKVDDPRNTLACNMLSFVDFYRPSYFLLENVDALLHAKLQAEQDGAKMVGGIKQGMIKFILRSLIKLGYQAHFKVLQAGQYGSPQSRLRVIFWGAKRTLPLPPFPIPTHCTPDDVDKYNLATNQRLWPAVRVRPSRENRNDLLEWLQFAPMLPVTVEDAIGDLPKFDWIDPHNLIKMTSDDVEEIQYRGAQGIARFAAVSNKDNSHSGYENGASYQEPRSRYQRWMRAKMGKDEDVTYHYTARLSALIVERTCNVPLKPDANHGDLPGPLRLSAKFYEKSGKSKMSYRSLYGRIDAKGPFSTALTTANPNHKGGRVLHPTQKRILTVREFARSQGFPDHHKFLSRNEAAFADQYKQIGNAVPVPLALALGKALGGVLLRVWKEEDESAREQSPEVGMDLD